jgi:hypothetical protein
MNIFKSNSVSALKSTSLLPRRTVADVSQHLYKLYEDLYLANRRMANMALALGGVYPIPTADSREAPDDICGRMFYDIDLLSAAMTEMEHHVSQLETITGLRPIDGHTGSEPFNSELESPGARGSDKSPTQAVPGASQPPPLAI